MLEATEVDGLKPPGAAGAALAGAAPSRLISMAVTQTSGNCHRLPEEMFLDTEVPLVGSTVHCDGRSRETGAQRNESD